MISNLRVLSYGAFLAKSPSANSHNSGVGESIHQLLLAVSSESMKFIRPRTALNNGRED
jgi:hypothetical protein